MEFLFEPPNAEQFGYLQIVFNMVLAFAFSVVVTFMYRFTHKGLHYSQSFSHTIVIVSVVVCIVMMVIGGSLARAFALVGALSIIRFRTVIKDTRDMAFVFSGLAVGMAAGTANYFLGAVATLFISSIAWLLHVTDFALNAGKTHWLRLGIKNAEVIDKVQDILAPYTTDISLINEADESLASQVINFEIRLVDSANIDKLVKAIDKLDGVISVVLTSGHCDIEVANKG